MLEEKGTSVLTSEKRLRKLSLFIPGHLLLGHGKGLGKVTKTRFMDRTRTQASDHSVLVRD